LQDLSQGETIGVLLKFKIANGIKTPLKFSSSLSFVDVTDKQHKEIVTENTYKPIKEKPVYLSHFNKDVLQQAIFFTANDHMESAMDSTDVGNYTAAKNYLNDNRYFMASNPVYVKGSAELQKIDSVNKSYSNNLSRINAMSKDSINWMQKINRNTIYKLKFKKKG
jgi:hypothetical protein